jgi:hypothetical protein
MSNGRPGEDKTRHAGFVLPPLFVRPQSGAALLGTAADSRHSAANHAVAAGALYTLPKPAPMHLRARTHSNTALRRHEFWKPRFHILPDSGPLRTVPALTKLSRTERQLMVR